MKYSDIWLEEEPDDTPKVFGNLRNHVWLQLKITTAKRICNHPMPDNCESVRVPFGIFFVHGDQDAHSKKLAEQIMADFDYWDKDSSNSLDVVLPGWTRNEGELEFDPTVFTSFRYCVEVMSKYRYSGGVDFILLNYEFYPMTLLGGLHFSEVMVLPLEEMVRNNKIGTIRGFLTELSIAARDKPVEGRLSGDSSAWDILDKSCILKEKQDLWQVLKNFSINNLADKSNQIENFSVKNICAQVPPSQEMRLSVSMMFLGSEQGKVKSILQSCQWWRQRELLLRRQQRQELCRRPIEPRFGSINAAPSKTHAWLQLMLAAAKRIHKHPMPEGCEIARFPVGIFFIRGDRGGDGKKLAEQVVASFDYWDRDTGDSLDVILAGWTRHQGELEFDLEKFLEFRGWMELMSKWRYSGEVDFLLLNFEIDTLDIKGRFDFSEVIVLALEEMLRNKHIGSLDGFLAELSIAAREKIPVESRFSGNSPVWELSNKVGILKAKKALWQGFKKFFLKDYADKINEIENFAVKDLRSQMSRSQLGLLQKEMGLHESTKEFVMRNLI
jgi:hypothetical protein